MLESVWLDFISVRMLFKYWALLFFWATACVSVFSANAHLQLVLYKTCIFLGLGLSCARNARQDSLRFFYLVFQDRLAKVCKTWHYFLQVLQSCIGHCAKINVKNVLFYDKMLVFHKYRVRFTNANFKDVKCFMILYRRWCTDRYIQTWACKSYMHYMDTQ